MKNEEHATVCSNAQLMILGEFGSLSWNSSEDKLVYVAEKKLPKTSSYFTEPKKTTDQAEAPISV